MRIRSNVAAVLAVGGTLAFMQDAYAQDYPAPSVMPQPAFTAPARRDLAADVANATPEPAKPAATKIVPPPEPAGADDEDDEDESSGSAIVITLTALALAVWLVFRAARRTPVNASGERDASGDRP